MCVWVSVCVCVCVCAHVTSMYIFYLILSLQPSGSAVCVYSASRSSGSVVNNGLYDIFTRQFVGGVDNNVVSVSALCPWVPCSVVWNHCTVRPHLSTHICSG